MKSLSRIVLTLGVVVASALLRGQIIDTEDGVVASIPVNYTEAKSGVYTLPDPLRLADGTAVTDAAMWREKRRPEIFRLLEENQFGSVPGRPEALHFEVTESAAPAFDGKALRTQVTVYFTADRTRDYVDLLLYTPASSQGPVPVLLALGWFGNNLAVDDPAVKVGRRWNVQEKRREPAEPVANPRVPRRPFDVMQVLERGFAYATFCYTDVDPDALGAVNEGIRRAYLKAGAEAPAADEWGSIAAWGWGVSRVIDYLETNPRVDARRVALTGASRLGKTVLWAAARDERIACTIASVSGEGGAALSRRNYGETVAHLVAPTRYPYQFAANYARWGDRINAAPFDSHFLISLIAPRALLLQTGNTDKWSDPYGEFLAAKAATPVYTLLGQKGIEEYSLPAPGKALMNRLGYVMQDGGHGVLPVNWPVFLDFMAAHLGQPATP